MNVALIGMAGAGKSYVGTRLADRLGWNFLDTDKLLEEKHQKSLQEILDGMGDETFMRAEGKELIDATVGKDQLVISPGGSIVYNVEAMDHLKKSSKIIYLRVPFATIEKRVGDVPRGIVGLGRKSLRELYDERISLYEDYADAIIDAEDRSLEEGLDAIVRAVS